MSKEIVVKDVPTITRIVRRFLKGMHGDLWSFELVKATLDRDKALWRLEVKFMPYLLSPLSTYEIKVDARTAEVISYIKIENE